jgi:hypothetical protein
MSKAWAKSEDSQSTTYLVLFWLFPYRTVSIEEKENSRQQQHQLSASSKVQKLISGLTQGNYH